MNVPIPAGRPWDKITWQGVLIFLLAARLALLILAPLGDRTEAHYAEIARKMVETRDWVIPQLAYGKPCLADPPLAMWLSATGIELFGANEFGARLPMLACTAGTLVLVASVSSGARVSGTAAAALLLAMPRFFEGAATVSTEAPLWLGVTCAMVSFHRAIHQPSRWSGIGVFAGLAVGLLAIGPAALPLILVPLFGWAAITRNARQLRGALPWPQGALLTVAVILPWLVLAVRRSPGSLRSILIDGAWHPAGTPGGLATLLALAVAALFTPRSAWRRGTDRQPLFFWLPWAVWPLLMPTPSSFPFPAHPAAALPALVLLVSGLLAADKPPRATAAPPVALVAAVLCLIALLPVARLRGSSERDLVRVYEQSRATGDQLLYFGGNRPSAEFYTDGNLLETSSTDRLLEHLDDPGRLFVAMTAGDLDRLPPSCRRRLRSFRHRGRGRDELFVERTDLPRLDGIDPQLIHAIGS